MDKTEKSQKNRVQKNMHPVFQLTSMMFSVFVSAFRVSPFGVMNFAP